MGKLPAFLFYPNDWRTDPNLCCVSKSARDTWMDMLCLMFHSEERGRLVSGGVPWTDEEISVAVRGEPRANLADLDLLLAKGVAVRDSRGCVFSKRMVRDEQERSGAKERMRKVRSVDVTPNVRQMLRLSSVTETEDEGSSGFKEKKDDSDLGVQQATSFVFLEVGLAGNEARMLANDAVNSFIHKKKVSPKKAAEEIVNLWNQYEKIDIPFKKGVFKFFKEGLWDHPEKWKSQPSEKETFLAKHAKKAGV